VIDRNYMGRMIKNEYNEKDIIRKLISLIQNGIIAYDEDACMPRQQLTMLLYFHHPILLVSVAPYLTNVSISRDTDIVMFLQHRCGRWKAQIEYMTE
jgi:hypothetical protein